MQTAVNVYHIPQHLERVAIACTERRGSPAVKLVITQIYCVRKGRFFVAERRLSLARRFNAG